MKKKAMFLLLFLTAHFATAQQKRIDSLKHLLSTTRADTLKIRYYYEIADLDKDNPDTVIAYVSKGMHVAQAINSTHYIAYGKYRYGMAYLLQGNYAVSLKNIFESLQLSIELNNRMLTIECYRELAGIYDEEGDEKKAVYYMQVLIPEIKAIRNNLWLALAYYNISYFYNRMDRPEMALQYDGLAKELAAHLHNDLLDGYVLSAIGRTQLKLKEPGKGLVSLNKAIAIFEKLKRTPAVLDCYSAIADYYIAAHRSDSAMVYSQKELAEAKSFSYKAGVMEATKKLAVLYDGRDQAKAAQYYKNALALHEELFNSAKTRDFQNLIEADAQQKKEDQFRYQQRLANEKVAQQKRYYISGIIVLLIISLLVIWNYYNQRKANQLLGLQQEKIILQRDQLADTLSSLKSAQQQLIQAEKMASLGELTAGIAHEIQNPLNFVNNFSEVSVELLAELKEEIETGNRQYVLAIADDLTQNLDRIHHHGKRADSIVKGMLEHSRTSSGQKELTDVNKLSDEYLRMAYQGTRAKDQTFNATLTTDFDQNLPQIKVIPQDVGRVLFNLFNNAFYATQQRKNNAGENYQPEVRVNTFEAEGKVVIRVTDNGNGIPDAIKDKIMQPFFTTKPTGQGTGLGLSLSYDIVVKGHNGTIEIESTEGNGSVFTVKLPLLS